MILEAFKHFYFRLPLIARLLITILFIMLFFGSVIHFIEPDTFPTFFEGIWWAFVTGATVGFGDFVPHTTLGRIIGILLILSGGGMITFYITAFSASTLQHEKRLSTGKVPYKGSNHAIFIGWNERTKQLIDMAEKTDIDTDIVVIDQSLPSLSYKKIPVHFIHGDPSEDQVLQKANIHEADNIIISANMEKDERKADNMTILTIVAVRGNNQAIRIVSEILSQSQIDNASRAGADTILRSNEFMSTIFYHELFHQNDATPFADISHLLQENQFEHMPIPDQFIDKAFSELITHYAKKETLLLGFIRGNTNRLNPSRSISMKHDDVLIFLSKWDAT